MSAELSTGSAPADRVLVITRVFDAPRNVVFKAWTEREHLAQWFGPRGFELTLCTMDLRPGGSYRFGMHSAEGTDHWLQGVYQEIVEPEKLVCTYAWADANGNATRPETVLELTFAEQDGKTAMTLRQSVFESVTACDMHRQGWNSSLDRFAEYVTKV